MDVFEILPKGMSEQCNHPILTKKEEQLLFRQGRHDEVIRHNYRLCLDHARKYSGRYVPIEDRFQTAVMVLCERVPKHDWRKSRISTHVAPFMKEELSVLCRNFNGTIQYQRDVVSFVNRLKVKFDQMTKEMDRTPTKFEFGMTDEFQKIKDQSRFTNQHLFDLLDSAVGVRVQFSMEDTNEENFEVSSFLKSEAQMIQNGNDLMGYDPSDEFGSIEKTGSTDPLGGLDSIEKVELKDLIDYYLKPLTDYEYRLFMMRNMNDHTLKEVAQFFGKSIPMIYRHDRQAKQKIKDHILTDEWLYDRAKSRVKNLKD